MDFAKANLSDQCRVSRVMNSVLCNWKADDLPKLLKIDLEARMN